jgi:anaerobic ribonucleoside-triphosphate reductase activating protein
MRTAASVRVGARVPVTRAEGPGARYALWVQGCSIRCPGCCNPHLFAAGSGEVVAVDSLLAEIGAARPAIEGVTFLGGEPFEQAQALARVATGSRGLGLSVMVFSGYTLEELRARADGGAAVLLRATDVLVDGRYDASLPERSRLWAGSRNQRFHYLTDRYGPEIERPTEGASLRQVEVRIETDGRIRANGWPALVGLSGGSRGPADARAPRRSAPAPRRGRSA